jgi:hypothetical protein
MSTRRWVDLVNILLGLWLISSPWLMNFSTEDRAAALSAWIMGSGLIVLAVIAMFKPATLRDALALVVGVWLMVSPWVLGHAAFSASSVNALVTGTLVSGYALWAMYIDSAFDTDRPYDDEFVSRSWSSLSEQ